LEECTGKVNILTGSLENEKRNLADALNKLAAERQDLLMTKRKLDEVSQEQEALTNESKELVSAIIYRNECLL
jgi:hypothetical protein